ncbi:hypothetical protein DRO33_03170, partial [Candidatus Bathyarchaeota archaeon]
IPLGAGRARIGLACRGLDPRKALRAFIKSRFGVSLPESPYAGSVLTCGPIPKTYAPRALVVGDAAGQAKPTTGGGVVLGCLCAREAGRVAAEALSSGDISEGCLRTYELTWRHLLGREFKAMRLARRLLNRLPPWALDLAFKLASELELGRELAKRADMDFQSGILAAIPRLLLTCLPNLAVRALGPQRWFP